MRAHNVLMLSLVLLPLACARTGGVDVSARTAHWQRILDKEVPVGSSRKDIEAWGKARGIAFEDTGKLEHMPLTLFAEVERAPADGVVCSHWQFNAMITLSPEGKSTKHHVSAAGTCP